MVKLRMTRKNPVLVDGLTVYLGGAMYLQPGDFAGYDIVVPLTEAVPSLITVGSEKIRHYPLPDFGGVPDDWPLFIGNIAADITLGCKILAFCAAGHGRTGTFYSSLIAFLERRIKDPIAAARRRHCGHAVETRKQAEAVFALKGMPLPARYQTLR